MYRRNRNYDRDDRTMAVTLLLVVIAALILGGVGTVAFIKKTSGDRKTEKLAASTENSGQVTMAKAENETEVQAGAESKAGLKAENETESQPAAEGGSETESSSVTETGSEAKSQSVTETESETESQPITETESETETQSVAGTESESELQSVTETENEAESQSVTETESEAESQSVTETESEAESQSVTETESESESQSDEETESENEAAQNPDKRTESEAETESAKETETESQPATESESEPESESETISDPEETTEAGTESELELTEESESERGTETEDTLETEENSQKKTDFSTELKERYRTAVGLYVVTGAGSAQLFENAGDEETKLADIPANFAVAVLEQKTEDGILWDRIDYYGLTGWIRDAGLTELSISDIDRELGTEVYVNISEEKTAAVYEEAGEGSAVVEDLNYGQEVTLLSSENGWGNIQTDSGTGWIPLTDITPYYSSGYYYVNTDTGMDLNVRAEPDAEAEIVTSAPNGSTYKIQEFRDGWGKIESGASVGWVMLRYMTPCRNSDGGSYLVSHQPVSENEVSYNSIDTTYTPPQEQPVYTPTTEEPGDELEWELHDELEWE